MKRVPPAIKLANPSGLCMCGCGRPTSLATMTNLVRGVVKGQAHRFVQSHTGRIRDTTPRICEGCGESFVPKSACKGRKNRYCSHDCQRRNVQKMGITVYEEWRADFLSFYAHIGPRPSADHSIDRIKNDRGYEPGNVRWATAKEQAHNRRRPVMLYTFGGQTMCLSDWAQRTGIKVATLKARLQLGTIERCIRLWSNPGELVLSPFAGIGSEGYEAIRLGRRFIGFELKPSYARLANENLRAAERLKRQGTLFEEAVS